MKTAAILAALLVIGAGPAGPSAAQPAPAAGQRTIVNDAAALARLRRNSGMTLQWISFATPGRGRVAVSNRGGLVHLNGSQVDRGSAGRIDLDGDVVSIDASSFAFRGRILIQDSPHPDRECLREGVYEFRVTQHRRYWRLQNIEACDGLADYVDIYF